MSELSKLVQATYAFPDALEMTPQALSWVLLARGYLVPVATCASIQSYRACIKGTHVEERYL